MITKKCKNCGEEFLKRDYDIKRSKNHFCSRSCSAVWNNKNSPKRQMKMDVSLREYKSRGSYRTYKTRLCEHARTVFENNNKKSF